MGQHNTSRGVTSLVGVVLLFAIVTAGMASVVMVGSSALADTQQEVDTDLAVKMFQAVDGQVRAIRKSPTAASGTVAIPDELSGKVVVDPDAASLNVTAHQNGSVTSCTDSPIDIGTMRYERDGEPVAIYQGGAVFKQAESGVSLHGTPHLQYRSGSLQFWLLQFDSKRTASEKVVLDNSLESTRNKTMSLRQELEDCIQNATTDDDGAPDIGVSVHSEYANGWYRYFSNEYPAENATYDETNQTATAVFDPGAAGDSNLSTDDSDSNSTNPLVCGTSDSYDTDGDDDFSWRNDTDIDSDGDEFDYDVRADLEVDCDYGDLEIEYEWENETRVRYEDDPRFRIDVENESEWIFNESTNLTEFDRENETDIELKSVENETQREQFWTRMGVDNPTEDELEGVYHRNRTEYEDEGDGVEYRERVRIKRDVDGDNDTDYKNETRDESDGVTMPSFGGPDEILTNYMSEFEADCLPNGWCVGMTDSNGSSSPPTQYVSIRILEVSTDE